MINLVLGHWDTESRRILFPLSICFLANCAFVEMVQSICPMFRLNVSPKFFDNLKPSDWPSPNFVPLSSLPNVVSLTVSLEWSSFAAQAVNSPLKIDAEIFVGPKFYPIGADAVRTFVKEVIVFARRR